MTRQEQQTGAALRVQLGSAWLDQTAATDLAIGAVIELDTAADGDVDVFVGRQRVARGTAVAVDGKLGVRISEVDCDA